MAKVSVIIAAKNEPKSIHFVVSEALPHAHEVIVVCDHEQDLTVSPANQAGAKVLYNPYGPGRGRALRFGVEKASGDIIVFMDADGSHEGNRIAEIILPIQKGEADLVLTSRALGSSEEFSTHIQDRIQHFGNRVVTVFVNLLCGSHISDLHYGFRAIRSDLAKSLNLSDVGMTTESELFIKAWRRKARVKELPAYERKRMYGRSHIRLEKIVWQCLASYFKHAFSTVEKQK